MIERTRLELRRMVGRGLGDCVVCTATAAGNEQTYYDEDHLDGPDNAYRGGDLWFPALNLRRRITASTQATGLVTWQKPLAAATAEGDEAELWNVRGIGIKPAEVNDFLNDALTVAAAQATVPMEATVAAAFDRDDPRLIVPAELTRGIYAVVWADDEGAVLTVDPASSYGKEGWFYDRASGRVVIGGSYLAPMDGQAVTIKGFGVPPPLLTDDDATTVSAEWLVAEATRRAVAAARLRNPDYERYLPPHWQEAMQKRDLPTGRALPNQVMF